MDLQMKTFVVVLNVIMLMYAGAGHVWIWTVKWNLKQMIKSNKSPAEKFIVIRHHFVIDVSFSIRPSSSAVSIHLEFIWFMFSSILILRTEQNLNFQLG